MVTLQDLGVQKDSDNTGLYSHTNTKGCYEHEVYPTVNGDHLDANMRPVATMIKDIHRFI